MNKWATVFALHQTPSAMMSTTPLVLEGGQGADGLVIGTAAHLRQSEVHRVGVRIRRALVRRAQSRLELIAAAKGNDLPGPGHLLQILPLRANGPAVAGQRE